jgi:hypothetical protein
MSKQTDKYGKVVIEMQIQTPPIQFFKSIANPFLHSMLKRFFFDDDDDECGGEENDDDE